MIGAADPTVVIEAPGRVIGDLRGPRDGPTLVLVGGLHANEPSGIEASIRVLDALEREGALRCGRVLAIRGNLAALAAAETDPGAGVRYIDHDLNRVFLGDAPMDSAEAQQRDEITGVLRDAAADARGACYLMDLHTVSSDSPAFVAVEDSTPALRFAMRLALPKVLGLEEELGGLLMDFAGHELGFVSCIVEAGRHDDPRSVDVHEASIRVGLHAAGLIESPGRIESGEACLEVLRAAAKGRAGRLYDVRQRETIRDARDGVEPGVDAFVPVRAGETLIAREPGRMMRADTSGLLFMPNRQREPRVGDDAFFVVRPVGRAWVALSRTLRRSELLHAALPRLLPGVRRRPGRSNELLIAPEIASVLRREILHLLGYRLMRWTRTPTPHPLRRVGAALRGSVVGLARMAVFKTDRAAMSVERPEDWIARRRRLDLELRARPSG